MKPCLPTLIVAVLLVMTLPAGVHGQSPPEEAPDSVASVADPLEPWNRAMFIFNDRLYFWFTKPIARGYKFVTPEPARVSIRNFFHNIIAPVRIVNCLLQGRPEAGAQEMGRLVVNTTKGLGGFVDVARDYPELEGHPEDLGQTLGVWRIGHGCYIVWPVFGSSSLRDTVGMAGDSFLNPISYVEPAGVAAGLSTLRVVNSTSLRLGDYETFKEAAIEPYEAFRNAYIQRREAMVAK